VLADQSESRVRSYLQHGILYVAQREGEEVGVVLAVPTELSRMELRAVAVAEAWQQQGTGKQMLTAVVADLNGRGYSRVTVGAANDSIDQIAFYQKVGFRMWKVVRDHFTPENGYPEEMEENGIPLRDMIWFERAS
jgi:N-acetylglutamate synthase-like GNAT family acetyltransferase